MNTEKRITEIRSLLESYYVGDISPDETRRLSELLAETPDLPSDLALEAKIMAQLDEASDATSRILPPTDLEERLIAITAVPKRHRNLWMWISSAAAAAIILCFIWRPVICDTPTDSTEKKEIIAASPNAGNERPAALATSIEPEGHDEYAILLKPEPKRSGNIAMAANTPKPIQANAPRRHNETAEAVTEDYYIEVCNPEQAAQISNNALQMLAATINAQLSSLNDLQK